MQIVARSKTVPGHEIAILDLGPSATIVSSAVLEPVAANRSLQTSRKESQKGRSRSDLTSCKRKRTTPRKMRPKEKRCREERSLDGAERSCEKRNYEKIYVPS